MLELSPFKKMTMALVPKCDIFFLIVRITINNNIIVIFYPFTVDYLWTITFSLSSIAKQIEQSHLKGKIHFSHNFYTNLKKHRSSVHEKKNPLK